MWDVEEIPCKTAAELMQDWSALEHLRRSGGSKRKQKQRDPRIHVLKIDAEGHDFQVCICACECVLLVKSKRVSLSSFITCLLLYFAIIERNKYILGIP